MKKIKVLAHPQSLPPPPGCSLRLPDSWMLTRYLPRTGALARAGRAWARECSRHLRANVNNKHAKLSGTPPEPPSHPRLLRFVGGNLAAYFRLICRCRQKKKKGVRECERLPGGGEFMGGKKHSHKHRVWTLVRVGEASRAKALQEPQLKKFFIPANTFDLTVSKGWRHFRGGGRMPSGSFSSAAGTINLYLIE